MTIKLGCVQSGTDYVVEVMDSRVFSVGTELYQLYVVQCV